jgi:FixJ family two-component response regulator
MTATANTIFLVDDDPSILKALERLLKKSGFDVQAFASARTFLERHDPETPGCALLDVAMEEMDGLELQRALVESGSDRPIVFLTGRGDIPMAVQAMRAGATGFLTKPIDTDDLLDAISLALEKDAAARQTRAGLDAFAHRFSSLTPRECEVFRQVVAGRLNKQIAADLGTVEKTIKVHRARVMEKMGARSLADLVRLAERTKIDLVPNATKPH